jgi:hypothetical protein
MSISYGLVYENDRIDMFVYLQNAFPWVIVMGNEDEREYKIANKFSLIFRNWGYCVSHPSSTTARATCVAKVNDIEIEIFSISADALSAGQRYYRFIRSNRDDFVFQIGTGNFDKTLESLEESCTCIQFVLTKVENKVHAYTDNKQHWGIYIPKTSGSINSRGDPTAIDPTPKRLITEDTTEDVNNGAMQFYSISPDIKITLLSNVCAVSSECVTTNLFVPMIMPSYKVINEQIVTFGNGEVKNVQMNGVKYLKVNKLFLAED